MIKVGFITEQLKDQVTPSRVENITSENKPTVTNQEEEPAVAENKQYAERDIYLLIKEIIKKYKCLDLHHLQECFNKAIIKVDAEISDYYSNLEQEIKDGKIK